MRDDAVPVEEHGGGSFHRDQGAELYRAARRRRDRELHHEEGPSLGCVGDPEAAAVEVDELAGDVQPEPRAPHLPGRAAVELMEALEDLSPVIGGDPRPAVGHLDVRHGVVGAGTQFDPDGAVGRGEFERVGEEVEQDLLHPDGVHLRRYGCVRRTHHEGDRAVDRERLEVVGDEAHQVTEIELGVVQLEFGRLDLGGVEQIIDVPEEHAGVAQDHLEIVAVRIVCRKVDQNPLGGGEDQ